MHVREENTDWSTSQPSPGSSGAKTALAGSLVLGGDGQTPAPVLCSANTGATGKVCLQQKCHGLEVPQGAAGVGGVEWMSEQPLCGQQALRPLMLTHLGVYQVTL